MTPATAAGRALLATRGTHQGGWWRNDVLAIEAEAAAAAVKRIRAARLPEPEGEGWDMEVRMTKRDLHTLLNRHVEAILAAEAGDE